MTLRIPYNPNQGGKFCGLVLSYCAPSSAVLMGGSPEPRVTPAPAKGSLLPGATYDLAAWRESERKPSIFGKDLSPSILLYSAETLLIVFYTYIPRSQTHPRLFAPKFLLQALIFHLENPQHRSQELLLWLQKPPEANLSQTFRLQQLTRR